MRHTINYNYYRLSLLYICSTRAHALTILSNDKSFTKEVDK